MVLPLSTNAILLCTLVEATLATVGKKNEVIYRHNHILNIFNRLYFISYCNVFIPVAR